jgi:hypothetical protein
MALTNNPNPPLADDSRQRILSKALSGIICAGGGAVETLDLVESATLARGNRIELFGAELVALLPQVKVKRASLVVGIYITL